MKTKFSIIAAVVCVAFFCVEAHGQVSHTTVFNNLVVRTNLTLGGVSRNTWPSGTGDVLASNDLTNQAPLLGAGGVSIFATNAVGFRSAVGLVIGTDVQAFSSTLSDWANLPTNSISAFLTEAEASALYQGTNANLTLWSAVAPSSYVLKAGDTMTGTLTVTGLTNSALTASRPVLSAADKSLVSGQIDLANANHVTGVLPDANVAATIARLASPALTGNPTVPTAAPGTSNTVAASTEFVAAAVASGGLGSYPAIALGPGSLRSDGTTNLFFSDQLKQIKYLTLKRPDYGDGAGAVPQTNTYTASGLMHYTFSGSAATNVNWVVYEAVAPPDLDTNVTMTATFRFLSGGTDADAVTFDIAYAQGANGTAWPTGTSIASSPYTMSTVPVTPASGDMQTVEAALPAWAVNLTPGLPLNIRVSRVNNSNDDTARDVELIISYGSVGTMQ